jgi:hypothetical protein
MPIVLRGGRCGCVGQSARVYVCVRASVREGEREGEGGIVRVALGVSVGATVLGTRPKTFLYPRYRSVDLISRCPGRSVALEVYHRAQV